MGACNAVPESLAQSPSYKRQRAIAAARQRAFSWGSDSSDSEYSEDSQDWEKKEEDRCDLGSYCPQNSSFEPPPPYHYINFYSHVGTEYQNFHEFIYIYSKNPQKGEKSPGRLRQISKIKCEYSEMYGPFTARAASPNIQLLSKTHTHTQTTRGILWYPIYIPVPPCSHPFSFPRRPSPKRHKMMSKVVHLPHNNFARIAPFAGHFVPYST